MSNATNQLKNVAVSEIFIQEDFNTRDQHELDWENPDLILLAEDIANNGLAEPLRLVPREEGGYWLRRGHRRMSAIGYAIKVLNADIKNVPAIVSKNIDDSKADWLVATDVHSSKLSPMAAAKLLKRMMDREGVSQTEAAKRLGITVAYAGDLKLLANAPEAIQEAVDAGVVASTEAARLIKQHGPEDAAEILEEAIKDTIEGSENTEGDTSQDSMGEVTEPAPELAVKKKGKKDKVTRKDTDKAADKLGKKPKSVPKKAALKLPEGSEPVTTMTPSELSQRAAFIVDNLIAQTQADNQAAMRREVGKLAAWLRDYLRSGYVVSEQMCNVTAETTDEQLEWITEPQGNGEVTKDAA